MQRVAALKDTGIEYRGIALVGSKTDFFLGVPDGGVDIQDTAVYWTLPGGKSVCYSVKQLAGLHQVELHSTAQAQGTGAYPCSHRHSLAVRFAY